MSLGPGLALSQADLDYRAAGVDKKVQKHVVASQGLSAELDTAFIMAIEMVCLFCACSNCMKLLFPTSGVTNVCAYEGLFLELTFSHMTVVCWYEGSLGRFVWLTHV